MGWSMDDHKVQNYINGAIAAWTDTSPLSKRLEMAWSQLYQQREKKDPDGDDRELAAAEHYMYARWQVASGETQEDVMEALTLGYDAAKLLGYIPLVFAIRKIAGHSWSRPSTDSIRWGMKGCSDGAKDK
jgi:hypothetical protein